MNTLINEQLTHLLSLYDLERPVATFLRHNENRTYRVQDGSGKKYLLRIHDPFVPDMAGLQHRFEGIAAELGMLEHWGRWNEREVQIPVRNGQGGLVTTFESNGKKIHASLLTWLEGRDLIKNDLPCENTVRGLGEQLANLHAFFDQYEPAGIEARPHQGKAYNVKMAGVIRSGVGQGLFAEEDADTIEQTLDLVNRRLGDADGDEGPGLIHGDIGLGNTILTESGGVRLIDFGFYGRGYALTDTAMAVMMLPADWRERFLDVYFGSKRRTENELRQIDGFMLVAIIGYYVFHFGNAAMHDWMRSRMPMLCREYCRPFLAGEPMLERIGF